MYSFGVLLCEMCIREQPDPKELRNQIGRVTGALRGLIQRCVERDPEARPSMSEIIRELEQLANPLVKRADTNMEIGEIDNIRERDFVVVEIRSKPASGFMFYLETHVQQGQGISTSFLKPQEGDFFSFNRRYYVTNNYSLKEKKGGIQQTFA